MEWTRHVHSPTCQNAPYSVHVIHKDGMNNACLPTSMSTCQHVHQSIHVTYKDRMNEACSLTNVSTCTSICKRNTQRRSEQRPFTHQRVNMCIICTCNTHKDGMNEASSLMCQNVHQPTDVIKYKLRFLRTQWGQMWSPRAGGAHF